MSDFDVVYFLTCQPVDRQGNVDKTRPYRSAVMHFGVAKLDLFNAGMVPGEKDEFTWVTDKNLRLWEGFMYDVSFCQRDPKANHFRLMIDPRGDKFKENELCGFSAKVVADHERSRMVPIFRGDNGKLMNVGGYDCYREYFCTFAPLPAGTYKERAAKLAQRPTLWEKTSELPPRTSNLRRRMVGGQPSNTHAADIELVPRHDMAPDVEAPLDLGGGELKEANIDDTLAEADLPPSFQPGSKDDPDAFEGEKIDGRLYEDGEN